MEANTKGINRNKQEQRLERENSIIKKEAIMMDNGKIIICTDMVSYFMPTKSLHMKDNGILIDFMEKAKSIMMSPYHLILLSTTQTLII